MTPTKLLLIVSLILSFSGNVISQQNDDNTIIVTVTDTSNLYSRVRQAITFTDLVIRDDKKIDTLTTLSEKVHGFSIFVVARVVIAGKKVEITGGYGLGIEDFWGYPAWPKAYKQIVYFKGSEAWPILRQIAIKLDGQMSYSKR